MASTNWETTVGTTWEERALSVALDSLCSGMSEYCESSFREDGFGDMNMSFADYGDGIGLGSSGWFDGNGWSYEFELEWPDDYTD